MCEEYAQWAALLLDWGTILLHAGCLDWTDPAIVFIAILLIYMGAQPLAGMRLAQLYLL
jgi:hypothetical protein